MKKSVRNLVLAASVLSVCAGSLPAFAGTSGTDPEPQKGKAAALIVAILTVMGY
ncbi:MAG TPA: hypothetical protein VHT24_01145 [Pseudacidobacterium sp.]|jgi:hypothetical protein|nr:hypothetical protein [Pseudacidobacterium sp.]